MVPPPLSLDVWLSEMLGYPAFNIDVNAFESRKCMDLRAMAPQIPCFFYAKTPADRLDLSMQLESVGMRIVDTSIMLAKPIKQEALKSFDDLEVRCSCPDDRAAVMRLAQTSFTYSRFHMDPLIPSTTANRIKAEWAGNYYSGKRGDHMVVAVDNQEIIGFLQMLMPQGDACYIDLIAVRKESRGRGVAAAMITFAERLSGKERCVVGTQAINSASLRLYCKLGFLVQTASYVFHGHMRNET